MLLRNWLNSGLFSRIGSRVDRGSWFLGWCSNIENVSARKMSFATMHRRSDLFTKKSRDRIIIDPDILAGKPILKGTRISVEFLLELLSNGWSHEAILENYPQIRRDDILAAKYRLPACTAETTSPRSTSSRRYFAASFRCT